MKLKWNKKCSKCSKNINSNNKSNLCNSCYHRDYQKKVREKRKEKGLCIICGKKVNPIITFPNGINGIKIEKIINKCYNCRIKYKPKKLK